MVQYNLEELLLQLSDNLDELSKFKEEIKVCPTTNLIDSAIFCLIDAYHRYVYKYAVDSFVKKAFNSINNPPPRYIQKLSSPLFNKEGRSAWINIDNQNYMMNLWGVYESFFRALFDNDSIVEPRDKEKLKKKYSFIPILKITSQVLKSVKLDKDIRSDFNKFTEFFSTLRNTHHNNSISSKESEYNLLGVDIKIVKNIPDQSLLPDACFRLAKKSLIIVSEVNKLLSDEKRAKLNHLF